MHKHHSLDSFGIREVSNEGIRIEKLSDRINPKVPFPHKHDFYQILLVENGLGWHQLDFNRYKVKARQVFVVKPGQTHAWSLKNDIKGLVIEFSHSAGIGTLIEALETVDDCFQLEKEDFQRMCQLVQLMKYEFEEKPKEENKVLQNYLVVFLHLVLRSGKGEKAPTVVSIVGQFKALVEKYFKEEHEVAFYAQKCHLPPKAFTMQLKRALGKSPRDVIQDRLMLESKRYLIYSDLSVSEIGYQLGFQDPNYFSRFFRVHEKCTPLEFKKKNTLSI
jgi:AraC family transcriptional activator of pobA